MCPQSGISARVARGISCGGRGGKPHEVTEPGGFAGLGVLAERHDMIFGSNYQQRWRLDQMIFIADRLLVDHLKGGRCRTCPLRIVGTQGHANQDVRKRLVHRRVGIDKVAAT